MKRSIHFQPWMILVALATAAFLTVLWLGFLWLLQPASLPQATLQPVLTIIPGPTATATQPPNPALTPTNPTSSYVSPEGFTIGGFVQIVGTEGAGLRLRSAAGTSSEPIFLAMDAEVFRIVDGPQEKDGFTWWFLEAPYDEKRAGWAASKYLAVVAGPP